MRGKGKETRTECYNQRITPAYAGKSMFYASQGLHRRDHPRLCGEKSMLAFKSPKMSGSPPPMRGKDPYPSANFMDPGITPAYAGKSGT